jgi:hypothetical protein
MNHFSYEAMGKEKIQDMQAEGLSSQAFHRSGAPKLGMLRGLPKIIVGLLGILGLLSLLIR